MADTDSNKISADSSEPEEVTSATQLTKQKSVEKEKSGETPLKINGDVNGVETESKKDKEEEPMEVDDDEDESEQPEISSCNVDQSKSLDDSKDDPAEKHDDPLADPVATTTTKPPAESSSPVTSMDADSSQDATSSPKKSENGTATKQTNNNNSTNSQANGAEIIHSIDSDSDEDDDDENDDDDCVPMEVDGRRGVMNGASTNHEDDDKPVSIGSDSSESESEGGSTSRQSSVQPKNTNGDNSNDVTEILSDKEEDCVVIEDSSAKQGAGTTGASSNRRKSGMNVRRFGGYDQNDDSLEEDPLNTPNNVLSNSSASSSPVAFAQKTTREPPALVMVDTNTLMKNKSHQLPSAVPAQGTYPIRTSGGAIGTPIQKPNSQLLPALTDDMFVLEAPSFIVPYIYEKPPSDPLKEVVAQIYKEVEEERKQTEAEKEASAKDKEKDLKEAEAAKRLLEEEAEREKKRQKRNESKRKQKEDDDWDELDTSDEDEESDGEGKTKVLIKDVENDISLIKEHIITPESVKDAIMNAGAKKDDFFQSPLGKFFMGIGVNLVQEHVQKDLLRQQKRKCEKEGNHPSASTQVAINSLMKNLDASKENNAPFKFDMKRCEYCNFKSESGLAMAHHYETPHHRNNQHRCNFCDYECKAAHEILYHMEAVHNIKGRIEKPISYHQCPNCLFEDNGKSKLARHALACVKKFKPESNLSPPLDWEPPAKIPKIKPKHGLVGTATAYQMAAQQQQAQLLAQQQKAAAAAGELFVWSFFKQSF